MADISSTPQPRICAVIPAFNESGSIAQVIKDIHQYRPDIAIVVVDDGSTDKTREIARSLGVILLRLPVNLGIGGAVQTGLQYASKNGFDIAVQFDGDGQHLAGELSKILEPVINGTADAVIGSRFKEVSTAYRASLPRLVGIRLISWVISALTGRRISDPTSGFRAYNRRALEFLSADYPQDYPEPETIIALSRNGFIIHEIQVAMKPRAEGKSSIGAWSAGYYMVKVLLATLIAAMRTRKLEE